MKLSKEKNMIYIVGKQCCICNRILTKRYIQSRGVLNGRNTKGELESLMCHDCAVKIWGEDNG